VLADSFHFDASVGTYDGVVAYRLRGTYFENCNCDFACPCSSSNLAAPATYDRCRVLLVFHVGEGQVDGVDVSGTSVAMIADTPKQMTDGGWRVGVFVDAGGSDEQREKLLAVFSGAQGGPPAMFGPLMGEMLGVEVAPIEYVDDGRRHSVRIGDAVDIEIEDFAGAEDGTVITLNGLAHPVGSTLALSRATRSKVDAFGLELDMTGQNGHSAPFSWQN
jgi:hypothetical protein